jgi:release factor glutamine methyltransferase
VELARRNAERHGVADRIEFIEGSLFDPLPSGLQVDCILSNPPYIPTAEIPNLAIGVRDFEPHIALDGGPSGVEVVAAITGQAQRFLKPGGQLILEIGAPQEVAVRQLIESCSGYELLPTIHDYAGHARVISARLVS